MVQAPFPQRRARGLGFAIGGLIAFFFFPCPPAPAGPESSEEAFEAALHEALLLAGLSREALERSSSSAVSGRVPPGHPEGERASGFHRKLPFVQAWDGFLRQRHYVDLENELATEERYELRNDFRLEAHLKFGDFATGKLSGNLELDWGADRDDFHREEQTLRLWEAYADLRWRGLDARIGQQAVRWGKGDEVNPIDNFTPQDLKELINLDRADRKLPIPAVDLKYYFTERLMWEGLWIPVFQESLIDESGEDWEPFFRKNYRDLGFAFFSEARPGNRLRNSTWATRLVHQGALGDISLSYAYHFEQVPSYERNIGLGAIHTVWPREHSVGSDFEFTHRGWGFRGETVFTTGKPHITNNALDENLVEEKDVLEPLLGMDKTFPGDFYMNVQLVQSFIFNHHDDMEAREYEASLTYRFWKKYLHDKLKLQTTGRYFLTDRNFFAKFDLTYEPRDNVEMVAGVVIFEGEAQGTLGQFDRNDQVYLSMKYHF